MAYQPANFQVSDLYCKCGQCPPVPPKDELLASLDHLANTVPLVFSCGVRCPTHNAAVGGAPDSRHLPEHADAVDIVCSDSEHRYHLVGELILDLAFTFIEVAPNHVHCDQRPGPYRIIMGTG